ncbi:uncharacterized protein LOC113298997 isoform X2 [Papaver somniferum]|nr:uncharacterized protein LOC113298997 isoform X2 [Papaver somniferum]
MILKMDLIHLRSEERKEFHDEMFVIPIEVNFENSFYVSTQETNIEYEPNLEVNEWTRDTMVLNRTLNSCYNDDDDVMLEEHVCSENFMEPLVSETLGFDSSTFRNDISSSIQSAYTCDLNSDLGLVQLFCESVHAAQLVSDLGKAEFSVDINNSMHENNFDMSNSLPRTQCVALSDFPMHETKFFDNHDSEFGLVELFYECEHAATLVGDLGDIDVTGNDDTFAFILVSNIDVPNFLPKSQTETLPPNLDLVCNKTVKPTFLKVPNLGLELCAYQVLLDYFAAKYNVFKEPQLECIYRPVPNKVHFELDLVHDEPLKLLDFVSNIISIKNFRTWGNSSTSAVLLTLPCYICVIRLLMFLHIIFWVDPQLFRLYI